MSLLSGIFPLFSHGDTIQAGKQENEMDRICWIVGNTHCQEVLQGHLDASEGVEHVVCTLNNPANGERFDEVHFLIPIMGLSPDDIEAIREHIFTRMKPTNENADLVGWFDEWYRTAAA